MIDTPACSIKRGLVLYDLERYAEAKEAFHRAVDEDICPLRALTSIQEMIREIAVQRGAPVLDFAAEIEERSDHGIPGSDHFLDHVHLTIEGYRLLALRLIDTLAEQGVVRPAESWSPEAIEAVTRTVEGKLDQRAHGAALRNLAKVFDWAGKLEEAERLARKAAELLGEGRRDPSSAWPQRGRPRAMGGSHPALSPGAGPRSYSRGGPQQPGNGPRGHG